MSLVSSGHVSPQSPPADPRWELALRLAKGDRFAKSPRLRDFLLYVCDAALNDRIDEITEHKIGQRVFGRPEHYNSSDDNIVRAHARLLRNKLEAYFNKEGASESLILRIPKVPTSRRFVGERQLARPHAYGVEPQAFEKDRSKWLFVIIAVLSSMVVLLAALLIGPKLNISRAMANSRQDLRPLWSQLFSSTATTTIVVPDSTFYMLQQASHRTLDLQTYLSQPTLSEDQGVQLLQSILPTFSRRRYTTFDALTTVIRVLNISQNFPNKVVVRYARDVTLRDLSPGNVVFIGRPASNLWEQVFLPKLNFRSHTDMEHHTEAWINDQPQPGEQAEYVPKREGNRFQAYGSIAFLPNLSGGNVLMISGSNSTSQEGLAEFVTDESMLTRFVHKIGLTGGRLPYFEALLLTTTVNEVSQEPSLVSYRVLGHQ